MLDHGFNCTLTCQQVPFFPFDGSQASEQREHAERMSAFLTWTSWAVLYHASQTFTVITFPWFFLCDSCLVNITAEIHYLICSPLPFSSPSGECQSTACGLFQSAVNSCWVPRHCLFLAHRCIILPSGLKRLPPFTVIRCDFDQRDKAKCARRDGLHAVKYCGVLVSVGWRHMEIKVNVSCDLGLWSHVHLLSLTWSLLTLLASRETNGCCI